MLRGKDGVQRRNIHNVNDATNDALTYNTQVSPQTMYEEGGA